MMKLFLVCFLATGFGYADDAAPSKEEMKKTLEEYVQRNQEASVQIMPLIERVRELLQGKENAAPGKEGRKPATDAAQEKAN